MTNSFRAQVNLQLMLAKKFLVMSQRRELAEDWGGHFEQTMLESALFRLLLAYRAHLGDLLETRNIVLASCQYAQQAVAALPEGTVVPELEELQDREQFESWLQLLLSHDFIGKPSIKQGVVQSSELLAVSASDDNLTLERLQETYDALLALVNRHRDTVQEY